MRRVLLDANALMAPVEVGVRVFDELDRLIGNGERSSDSVSQPITAGAAEPAERVGTAGPVGNTASENVGVDSGIDGVTLLVPRAVCRELDALSSGNGTEGTAASVGADLARKRCRELDHEATHADDAVCELATDPREVIDYVVTSDRALIERLQARGVRVIRTRGHDQLTIADRR